MDFTQVLSRVVGKEKKLPTRSILAQAWLEWYRGDVNSFHNYRIYNGTKYLSMHRFTMQMAKQLSETFANLLLNERCDIILKDADKELLDDILEENDFWLNGNESVERAFALGMEAAIANVVGYTPTREKARVSIEFVDRTKIYPITIEGKRITECAFRSVDTDGENIVIHVRDETGTYWIHNFRLVDGKIVDEYKFNTNSKKKWFHILRPNISSNALYPNMDIELGVSVYANSIDVLKSLDIKYDEFVSEYILSKKKVYVSAEAWNLDSENGAKTRTFDPMDSVYYQLPENAEGKPIITESASPIRYEAFIKGINADLDYLSMKCGLGESFYKFDGGSVATATQVMSENSTLFRTVKKHEILLESFLRGLVDTVIYINNEFTNQPKFSATAADDIVIKFDDSIIEDKGAEMQRDKEDVSAGLMAKEEYREKWYGETPDEAAEKVREYFLNELLDKYIPALSAGAMTPEQFVEKVYPKSVNKEELIAYISEKQSAPTVSDMNMFYSGEEVIEDVAEEE